MIAINGYFRTQPVTGQQRYAAEIADRMMATVPGAIELRPPRRTDSRAAQWAHLQTRAPLALKHRTLVSLTARAPAFASGHVVTIHDLFPLTNPEWFSPNYVALHSRLLRHHLRRAAAITVVSEPVREEVEALAAPGVPVVLAPNAPTAALLADDSQGDRTDPWPERYFLAVGSVEPRKNLGRLAQAYRLLPRSVRAEVPLLVVGGQAAAFREVSGLTEADDDIKLLGRVDDATLATLYRRATAFVSVSLAEGFGIPVIEAANALHGSLVISDIPVYRWIADAARPVFVEPTSVESIAWGLTQALSATPDLAAMRSIGTRFSWDESAHRVAELARSVAGR